MPLLFQGVKGSTIVKCPKGKYCKDKCGEKVLFNLGDQCSNKCKYLESSELAWRAQETFKLDKVGWICHLSHINKGVAEGKAMLCQEFGQTFAERKEGFLTIRLRDLSRDIEEG